MRKARRGAFAAGAAAALLLSAPAPAAEDALSGRALLDLCRGAAAEKFDAPTGDTWRCRGYFEGAVDALETLKTLGAVTLCLPRDLTIRQAILLFKKEAGIFPEVLDRRASDLIAGMLAKFFPCRETRARGAEAGAFRARALRHAGCRLYPGSPVKRFLPRQP